MTDNKRSIHELKGRFAKSAGRKKSERSAVQKLKTKANSAEKAKADTASKAVISGLWRKFENQAPDTIAGGADPFMNFLSGGHARKAGISNDDLHDVLNKGAKQAGYKGGLNGYYQSLVKDGIPNADAMVEGVLEMNNDDLNELVEDNTNDKSDDGEGMDKVQPKALNKRFKKRKDKDIDNDGDTDSSDEYLHKRRKAISKNVDEAASKFSAKEIKMAVGIPFDKRYKGTNYSGAEAAIEKIKTGLSDHPKVADALKRANEAVVLTVQHPTWGYGEVLENLEDDMSEVLFEHGVESVGLVDVDILAYDDGEDFTEELEAALEESLDESQKPTQPTANDDDDDDDDEDKSKKRKMAFAQKESREQVGESIKTRIADKLMNMVGDDSIRNSALKAMWDATSKGLDQTEKQVEGDKLAAVKKAKVDLKKIILQAKSLTAAEKNTASYIKKEFSSMNESVDLEEGKMKEFHAMVKQGMTAAQIAKKIGMKEKDVADFMKNMKESVDLDKLPMGEATEIEKEFNDVYTLRMDSYANAMKRMWESKNSPQTKNAAPGEDKDVERELDGKKIKKLHRGNVKDDDTEDKSHDDALKAASATKQAPTRRGDNRGSVAEAAESPQGNTQRLKRNLDKAKSDLDDAQKRVKRLEKMYAIVTKGK